jgi:2-iminobutanoate/2-iminopropanoate deaminase
MLSVLLCGISAHAQPEKKFLTRDGARPANSLFAPGVIIGKTVYISGKGDYKPDEPIEGKVRNCLNEIKKSLEVAGLDYRHIVKCWCYLENPDWYPEFNRVYGEFFPNDPPARTTLGVPHVPGDSRIEITAIAYTDLSEKKRIGAPVAGFPFSSGILAGTTLYISGKGDHLPDGGHPATFEAQARQAMRNVEAVLKEAGLDFKNVVFANVYLDNYDNWGIANKVFSEFFAYGDQPALGTVFVDWIHGDSHIEITCIATTDLAGRKAVRPKSRAYGPDERAMTASPAMWAGDTLYMSNMSGATPWEGITTVDLEAQTRRMAENHIEILNEAGLGLEDIVSGCVYLRNINDYAPFNAIYRDYFTKGPGVRTCLMPNSGYEKNDVRVRASFIAARTKK